MADEPQHGQDPSDPGAAGGEPGQDPGTGGGTNGGGAGDGFDGPFDESRARALIEKLRPFEKQANEQSKELEQLRTRIKEIDDAKLSETEKLNNRVGELEKRNADLEAQLARRDLQDDVAAAGRKAGALYPDALFKLIDPDDVERDEQTGKPSNLDKLVERAKKAYPNLFGRAHGSADGGARPPASGVDMNARIRQAAGR